MATASDSRLAGLGFESGAAVSNLEHILSFHIAPVHFVV